MRNAWSHTGQAFIVKKSMEGGQLTCSWDGTTNIQRYTHALITAMCIRKKAQCER